MALPWPLVYTTGAARKSIAGDRPTATGFRMAMATWRRSSPNRTRAT